MMTLPSLTTFSIHSPNGRFLAGRTIVKRMTAAQAPFVESAPRTTSYEWIDRNAGRVMERITVAQAMSAYVADYQARGGRALRDLEATINAHILPRLGNELVDALTFQTVKQWHHDLASAPARLRTCLAS